MFLFDKNQVRNVLLDNGVESFVAAAVGESIHNATPDGIGFADLPDGHQAIVFDGRVSKEKWPEVYNSLKDMPSDIVTIVEEMPSANQKNIEFTLHVSNKTLSDEQSDQLIEKLGQQWGLNGESDEATVADFDDLPTEMDEF